MASDYIPFFRSYAEYYWRLGTEAQKAEYIDMILDYAFNGAEPSVESPSFGVFTIIKPSIDRSLAILAARSKGGRAKGARKARPGNRNASKTQLNATETQRKRNGKGKGNSSYLTTFDKSENARAENATETQLPTDWEMRLYASQLGVPESYLPEFLEEWRAVGWQRVNRGGSLVTLNRLNFKSQLGAFWRQRQKNAATAPTAGGMPAVHIQADYALRD